MSEKLDDICITCFGQGMLDDEPCKPCEGYGYFLTAEGRELVAFLQRRGLAIPMSPLADDELRGMLE